MAEHPERASAALRELSSFLLSEENIQTTLTRIADLASRVLSDVEAGVTIAEDGRPVSTATTDPFVETVDSLQVEFDEGPCLHALRAQEITHTADFSDEGRWPQFSEQARAAGVRSTLALPLIVGKQTMGTLNLYSRETNTFDAGQIELARAFAAQAAVALHNSLLYGSSVELSQQLQEALESRAVIDQAKGILMERERVGADQAFEMLRTASQELNIKVREIAKQIVEGIGTEDH